MCVILGKPSSTSPTSGTHFVFEVLPPLTSAYFLLMAYFSVEDQLQNRLKSFDPIVTMQTIRPSQVPEYLRNTSFYLGMNLTDDSEFEIPSKHMKLNMNVDTLSDTIELLNTIRFWGVVAFPQALIDFAALQKHSDMKSILEPYSTDLPFICAAYCIASEDVDCGVRLEKAMDTGNIDVVQYFHKTGMQFTARAIALAAGRSALDCLQYALSATTSGHYPHRNCNQVFSEAVRSGCMDSILLLRQFGFSLQRTSYNYHPTGYDRGYYIDLCKLAASSGQCEVLKYLHSQGCGLYAAATAAADADQFDCLEYATNNGARLRGENFSNLNRGTLAQRLERANHLNLLVLAWSWLYESGTVASAALPFAPSANWTQFVTSVGRETEPSIHLIAAAVKSGNLTCLEHVYRFCTAKAETIGRSSNWLSYAASLGNGKLRFVDLVQSAVSAERWECLRFLITHDCPMNKSLTTWLVYANQLELYHLAVDHGSEVSVQAACFFVRKGNLPSLQHALEHGCERSEEILRAAARHGHLQCLMYAHAQGCPWSSQVTLAAARGGHRECLQFLYEHGCPFSEYVRTILRQQSNLCSLSISK